MKRNATIDRETKETKIHIDINLDGNGIVAIDTGILFMDHMINLMAVHGFMDLKITANGDIDVDYHHTVEDLGICFGKAINDSLGDKKGIRRYGQAWVPMDEALSSVIIDISNRPYLAYRVLVNNSNAGNFDIELLEEFFRAFVNYSGVTMHVDMIAGKDPHHIAESIFKAFGKALDVATMVEERLGGKVPSTKGIL